MEVRAELNKRVKLLRDRDVTLAELVRDQLRDDPGSTRFLLYVDQWEELYTLATPREIKSGQDRTRAEDAKLFIDLVLEAAASSPCTLVVSVRSDFYPDLQAHDGLRVAVQNEQVSLGTMNEAELRGVIEGPPKTLGASVDPELTKRLIRDIGLDPASDRNDEYDIGKLPLLEYALEQAWAKRSGPRIGLPQYSGLEQALEERANTLYGRLSAEEQAAAKRLFVSLVSPGEGREDTRARIDMPDDDAMRRVIKTFAGTEARLIVTDEAGGRRSVEVSHEALIRHWDKLRTWIDDNRDKLRTREFLKANRAEWLKHNRDPGLLGLPSLYLEAARDLKDQPGDVVIDDIEDYIEALLEHERRRVAAEEANHREELEAAQRLADERAKSEETERRLRLEAEGSAQKAQLRSRAAAMMAILFLIGAVAAAVAALFAYEQKAFADKEAAVANDQKTIAERQTREAYNQRTFANEQKTTALQNEAAVLTALSDIRRPTDPMLAAKLALAAWPRSAADHRPKLAIALVRGLERRGFQIATAQSLTRP
jgi:Novel STAND NTPase 1